MVRPTMIFDRVMASSLMLSCAMLVAIPPDLALAARKPATPPAPIGRSPSATTEVAAPELETIPEDMVAPEVPPEPEPPAPAEEAPTAKAVEGDDANYLIDTSTEDALDADVLAAESEKVDIEKLHRRSVVFMSVGVPLVAIGAAGLIGGSVLGTFENEAEVDLETWAPLMLVGAVVLTVGMPLVARGVALHRQVKTAKAEGRAAKAWQAAPIVSRSANGWMAGVAARF